MGFAYLKTEVWLRKVERNWQDHGLGAVIRKSLAYLVKPLYEHRVYRLYKIDLLSPAAAPYDIEGVSFRFLTPDDAAAIDQVEGHSEWLRGTVASRLRSGALCIAAFENGELAGFNLVSSGNVYMPLVRLGKRFRHDEAWSEQIAVVKDLRKKGLGANLRYRIFRELRERGFRMLYGGALAENIASLKLARRVGFQEFVDIRYIRILGWTGRQYERVKK
ncbi:MAG: GNAT family N-acetyltransferase [Candidatus Korobacteraceae bacterium]|jgi:GNAT superfamily N-acetyltransferase